MDAYLNSDKFPIPAVIVMDQHLPGADGIDAQEMLRSGAMFERIPIVAISGTDQKMLLQSAVDLGAEAWMTKPFSGERFMRLAEELNLPLLFDRETPRRAGLRSTAEMRHGTER